MTDDRFQPRPIVPLRHPEWSRAATLYQLNARALTPEGTLDAAATHLARLKGLGVDLVWLMPIHPIGVLGRKGSLGSPYAVRDYRAVTPELARWRAFAPSSALPTTSGCGSFSTGSPTTPRRTTC